MLRFSEVRGGLASNLSNVWIFELAYMLNMGECNEKNFSD
jgi:hypothetical protein